MEDDKNASRVEKQFMAARKDLLKEREALVARIAAIDRLLGGPGTARNAIGALQSQVCEALSRGGPQRVTDLARDLRRTTQTTNQVLAALCRKGSVVRLYRGVYGMKEAPLPASKVAP